MQHNITYNTLFIICIVHYLWLATSDVLLVELLLDVLLTECNDPLKSDR